MLSTAFALAIIFAASTAAPTEQVKRSCQTEYSPTLWTVHSLTSFPAQPHKDQVLITRGSGPTKGFTDSIVEFQGIPQGSWGCQFELDYQPGHRGYFSNESGDASRVNVYQVNGDLPAEVTWNNLESTRSVSGTHCVEQLC